MYVFKRSLFGFNVNELFAAAGCVIGAMVLGATQVGAADPEVSEPGDLGELRDLVERQRQQIGAQERAIARQRERLNALEQWVAGAGQPRLSTAVYDPVRGVYGDADSRATPRLAQGEPDEPTDQRPARPPASKPQEPPEVSVLVDRGGVLTPGGSLIMEPAIEYTKATSNQLNFRGISIVEGFLVGIIEATDSDRDTISPSITSRLGITDRLELEAKVPYVIRDDRVTSTVTGPSGDFTVDEEVDGEGLGDVEVALHYQINDGTGGWPFFIGNVRYKSNTGEGPFDVDRDADGVPKELATGSGFHAVEPSLTVIYPSDPAVLFANVSYLWNIEENVNERVGGSRIGDVDPGDSLGISFGLGVALNERLSFSLGYQHDFVFKTETEIDGSTFDSEELSVGSLLFGSSYQITDRVGATLTAEIGATEDAPDVRMMLRVPVRFDLF